jgi:glutathione reductase (NADPH)
MTSEQAKESDHDIEVIEKDGCDFYNNKRVNGSQYHFVLILEKQSQKILGAHILGPEASEQINLLAFAMTHGIPYNEFEDGIFTYPSWSNDLLSIR